MSSVSIMVSEKTALALLQEANHMEVGVSDLLASIAEELESKRGGRQNIGSVASSDWIGQAIEEAKKLKPGQEFSLWDLLQDYWDELPERRVLGRMVRVELEKQGLAYRDGNIKTPMAEMARYVRV